MRKINLNLKEVDLVFIIGLALIILLVILAKLYFQPLYEKEISIENALYIKWAGASAMVLAIGIFPKYMALIFLSVVIGTILNATALAMNDGYMPASACLYVVGHHIPMNESARVPLLCDWIFGSISMGDLFLVLAGPIAGLCFWKFRRENEISHND